MVSKSARLGSLEISKSLYLQQLLYPEMAAMPNGTISNTQKTMLGRPRMTGHAQK